MITINPKRIYGVRRERNGYFRSICNYGLLQDDERTVHGNGKGMPEVQERTHMREKI